MSKYHFFWKGPLSQWKQSTFYCPSFKLVFNCAEQYMMYAKAILFNDQESASQIMQVSSPRTQQAIGRKVRNFNLKTWNKHAKAIVYRANYLKFTQNPELLKVLMDFNFCTDFVEASPMDRIWGIGVTEDHPGINDPKNWKGTNWLGECITDVRNDIYANLTKIYKD